jgi:hypothetical protein
MRGRALVMATALGVLALGALLVRATRAPVTAPLDGGPLQLAPLAEPDEVVGYGAATRVVEAHRRELDERCWTRQRGVPVVRLAVELTARSDGTAGEVRVRPVDAGGASPELLACVTHQVERWRFPAAEEPTRLTVPLVFGAGAR